MQNKILYLDSLYYESLMYPTLVVMHTSIKNMFLHRNSRSTYDSLFIFNIRVNLLISQCTGKY